ncbi:hypothetical protein CNR22_17815 [Sphingobacteriaceae bacterium]|nr:hypothetical protein CNR22_17815 [Sphingobacteriaceae bacterium]
MQLELLIKDSATTILAVSAGLVFYRKINLAGKLFLLQAIIYLIFDSAVMNSNNNVWIYNIYTLVETFILFLAAGIELKSKRIVWILTLMFGAFLLIYIPELIVVKLSSDFVYMAALTEYIFISCIYTFILYQRLNPSKNNEIDISLTVISFGLVVFCAGSIPCLAAMKQLMHLDIILSKELFKKIVVLLAVFRYLLLAIGFILSGKRINYNKGSENGQI